MRPARIAPVDPFEKISELGCGDLHRIAIPTGRPDELPRLQSPGVKRHADPVVPEQLDQVALAPAKAEDLTGMGIAPETLLTVKIPVVVLLEIRGYKHFVVLQRADKDWVYIGDPVLGHKRYSHDDFVKGWNGIVFAVLGEGYDKANVLLDPPLPLTAKSQMNEFRPVGDAELMDFGFIQSDFF